MDVAEIRAALKQQLDLLEDIQIYDYEPDSPNVPCIVAVPDEPFIDYHKAMAGGLVELNFRLTVLVPLNVAWAGQGQLDALLSSGTDSATSIIDTLYGTTADGGGPKTLGGAVSDVHVTAAERYGQRQHGNEIRYLGADLRVIVRTTRT